MTGLIVPPEDVLTAINQNAPTKISTSPRVIPVCAAWFLPNDPQRRVGIDAFKKSHLPNARFFDLEAVADTSSPYAHMLPSPQVFQEAMSALGIERDDRVVVYDTAELGILSAPRVAWTFQIFGHPEVHILNNFKIWIEKGFPVETGDQKQFDRTEYPLSALDEGRVAKFLDVKHVAQDHNKEGREEIIILDARPTGRWKGTDPEPRPGLSSGHMPGSISLPHTELLNPNTKALLPAAELRKVFASKGVDGTKPIISTCGTGVTASVIDAALTEAGLGQGDRKVYDGSWTEWASRVQARENLIVKQE